MKNQNINIEWYVGKHSNTEQGSLQILFFTVFVTSQNLYIGC